MRALILPAAALALAGAVVLVGGRMVETPDRHRRTRCRGDCRRRRAVDRRQAGAARLPAEDQALTAQPSQSARARPAGTAPRRRSLSTEAAQDTARSRLVAPAIVAPPDLAAAELQREAPREPLSQLSLALPPKPEMKNEWAGTAFFRPVAIESAVFESMGRTIAIVGRRERAARRKLRLSKAYPGRAACAPAPPSGFGFGAAPGLPAAGRGAGGDISQMPPRQAGCRRVAGGERLGAGCARRPLCAGRGKGARGKDGHFRRAAGHLVDIGCS